MLHPSIMGQSIRHSATPLPHGTAQPSSQTSPWAVGWGAHPSVVLVHIGAHGLQVKMLWYRAWEISLPSSSGAVLLTFGLICMWGGGWKQLNPFGLGSC